MGSADLNHTAQINDDDDLDFSKIFSKSLPENYKLPNNHLNWNERLWCWFVKKTMKIPVHVGIIPDGNRRKVGIVNSSSKNDKTLDKKSSELMSKVQLIKAAYSFGLKSLKRNILLLDNLGVKEISVYAMSLDNVLSRESYQRDYLLKMFENFLMKILDEKIVLNRRVNFLGQTQFLPESIRVAMQRVHELSLNSVELDKTFNFCIAYSGVKEMHDVAMKVCSLDNNKISDEFDRELTKSASDIDLVIRTGYHKRLSDFLPWQSRNACLCFPECYWPDLGMQDLFSILIDYNLYLLN